jgi:TolB-like protein/DNA-binding SARP family transcriptional activator
MGTGPLFELRLMGGFAIKKANGEDVSLPGRKMQALLACLALPPGSAWPREQLIALLWGTRDEEQARGSLREALVKLRRKMGEPSVLRASREAVWLDPAIISVDAVQFARLAKAGELERAAELYRGEFLDGLSLPDAAFEDWRLVERTRLHDLAVDVLSRLMASQNGEAALLAARRLLRLDPTCEEAHRELMRLHAAASDRSQALRQYQICRDTLGRELGVAPSPETEALYREVKGPSRPPPTATKTPPPSPAIAPAPDDGHKAISEAAPHHVGPLPRPRTTRLAVAIGAFILVLAAAVAGAWRWVSSSQSAALPLPDRPSIAVLPFDNRTGDERLGRLADGMVDDIIINLSRFRELFVIARTSTFVYRDKPADVREVGRNLGVRYVLEGYMRSGKAELSVDVQLIDAATGMLVWSQDYDGPLDDLFAVQGDIAARIAGSIGGQPGALRRAVLDIARRRSPQTLQAYDLFLLGNEARLRITKEDHDRSMELLQRAVALDPMFQPAHVALALGHWNEVDYGWAPFQPSMDAWLKEAQRAVELDPGDAMGHALLGLRYGYANDFARNLLEFNIALNANLNDPDALSMIGGQLAWVEPPGRAVALVERAQRLNPFASKISHMSKLAYYFAGNFETAVASCNAHGERNFFDYEFLAMSYGELGRPQEAKSNAAEVLRLKPQFSAEWALTYLGEFAPAAAANRDLFLDGLAKAGLPICATAQQVTADPGIKRLRECDAERSTSN